MITPTQCRLVYLKYRLKCVHCRKMSEPDVKLTGIWKHFNSYTIRGRANVSCLPFRYVFSISGNTCNGSFALTETDSGTDSDSKPDAGFPLRLENLEKWEGIFQSGNLEQTGKVRENHTKYWKTQGIWDKYYLIFLVIFKWTVYYLLKWIKFSVKKNKTLKKILEKWQKILEKSGNFVSPEKWEPCDGYFVLCRICSHCTDFDSDPCAIFLCRTGIRIGVRTQVHLRQCKWVIKWYESPNKINLKQKEKLGVHPCVAKKHSGQSTKGIRYKVFVPCFEYVHFEEKNFCRRYQFAPQKKSIHSLISVPSVLQKLTSVQQSKGSSKFDHWNRVSFLPFESVNCSWGCYLCRIIYLHICQFWMNPSFGGKKYWLNKIF